MTDKVRINNRCIDIKEFAEQRVITFRDIDWIHRMPKGTAKARFYQCRKWFIEGEDFFFVNAEDVLPLNTYTPGYQPIPGYGLTVLTEEGYLLLAKGFDDLYSWDIQRKLRKMYFHADHKEESMIPTQTVNEYLTYVEEIDQACECIIRSSVKFGTKKQVVCRAFERMRRSYGVCWEQEQKEFYAAQGCLPESKVELAYWLECSKPVHQGLLISNIEALGNEVRTIKKPAFPANDINEIRACVEYIMVQTKNASPHGSAFYKKLFTYTEGISSIDWVKSEDKCRRRLRVSPSQRISKMMIAEHDEMIRKEVIKCFNSYVQQTYSALLEEEAAL